jgi:hypothetical protein
MAATVGANVYTLMDWAKTRAPNFESAYIAQLLAQSNEIMYDMTYIEGNLPTGHMIVQQTGLPTTYLRQANQAVQVSRGQTSQIEEGMAIFETWMEIDHLIRDLHGDAGQFMFEQSRGYFESMIQRFCKSFFYGDPSVDARDFLGLAPRYSTVTGTNAANAQNVLDGGGTGSVNTSIWLLTFGPTALSMFYPKGSAAGIKHQSFPNTVIQGSTGIGGTRMVVQQDQWQLQAGMALTDWRWCVRGANIDSAKLKSQVGACDLVELMIDMMERIPSQADPPLETGNPLTSNMVPGKRIWVMNRPTRAALRKQALAKSANTITYENIAGRKVMHFMDIPIRNSDQITNAEAQLT